MHQITVNITTDEVFMNICNYSASSETRDRWRSIPSPTGRKLEPAPAKAGDEGIIIKVFFLILNPLTQPNVAGLSCPASCGSAFRDQIRSRRICPA